MWGFTAILGDLISLDAIPLVTYRMLIAVSVIYLYLRWKKINTSVSGPIKWKLMGAGVVIALHWITFFHAIKISNVSITLACISSGSLFVALFEPIFFKRKISFLEIVLGLTVVAGVSTIFYVETEYTTGIIVALISASLSALFSVFNGLLVKKQSSAVITVYELFGGWLAISLFMISTIALGGRSIESIIPTADDVIYLLILGTVATAYAFIKSVEVMKYLSPFTVVLTINLEPVYGILLAYFIFGKDEKMSAEFYFGASIILLSVVGNGILKRHYKRRLQQKEKQSGYL